MVEPASSGAVAGSSPAVPSITWHDPSECDPPHRVTHPEKLEWLTRAFSEKGWGRGYPVLWSYEFEGRIQLISGSHRWAAACAAEIKIPVCIIPYEYLSKALWGTPAWIRMMLQPPLLD